MSENENIFSRGREISNEPPISRDAKKFPVIRNFQEKLGTVLRRSLETPRSEKLLATLHDTGIQLRKELEDLYPNYPKKRLDALMGISLGATNLEERTLQEEKTDDLQEKERCARMQHSLTHEIIAADSGNNEQIRDIYNVLTYQSEINEKLGNRGTRRFWGGLRSEVAIIRTLIENDYRVFLPDYAPDSNVGERQNEVLQLDVRNGIDFVAISPDGHTLLIDAKGKYMHKGYEVKNHAHPPKHIGMNNLNNKLVKKFVAQVTDSCGIGRDKIVRTEIVVPTNKYLYDDLPTPSGEIDTAAQREFLSRFAKPKRRVKNDIMTQIDEATAGTESANIYST